jgi:nucleoside-triphosphatase THEP1
MFFLKKFFFWKRSFCYENIFTPGAPIVDNRNLFGRDEDLKILNRTLKNPGVHPIVVGNRGVGKTSLVSCGANAFKGDTIKAGCSDNTTFSLLFYQIFKSAGFDISKMESSTEKSKKIKAKSKLFEVSGRKKRVTKRREIGVEDIDPWTALSIFLKSKKKLVIVIDEYDAIPQNSEEFHKSIASFIKHLSNHSHECKIKLVILGVTESAIELLLHNKSIKRNVFSITVNKLSSTDIYEFLSQAEDRLRFNFEELVKRQIALRSMGYPFYAHLMGLYSINAMLDRDSKARIVTAEDYKIAVQKALDSMFQSEFINYRENILTLNDIEKKIIDKIIEKNIANTNELLRLLVIESNFSETDFLNALENLEKSEILRKDKDDNVIQFVDPLLAPFLSHRINRGYVDDAIFDVLSSGI